MVVYMNAIGNGPAKKTMLDVQLSSLLVVYADRKMLGNDLQMNELAIRNPKLNRFAHTWQSFFITAFDIKLIFLRFHIDRNGFQGQYGATILDHRVKSYNRRCGLYL
jgi:hypothetical protein